MIESELKFHIQPRQSRFNIHDKFQIEMEVNMTKIVLFLLGVCLCAASSQSREEIPDFEFDDNFETSLRPTKQRESSFAFDDFDDFFVDDGEPEFDIATKEKIVHRALLKALAAKDLKYKFSEVLPLLRALSKSQRMVFASIISAQINGGKSLTLDEVKQLQFIKNMLRIIARHDST